MTDQLPDTSREAIAETYKALDIPKFETMLRKESWGDFCPSHRAGSQQIDRGSNFVSLVVVGKAPKLVGDGVC